MERDPCPQRILMDCGIAFSMGAILGGLTNGFKGARYSPKGARTAGFIHGMAQRGPMMGSSFAAWGLLFSSFDCSLAALRRKEDPFNPITSGFLTSFTLAMRSGPRKALGAGVVGGVFLALIEGMSIYLSTAVGQPAAPPVMEAPDDPVILEGLPDEAPWWKFWDRGNSASSDAAVSSSPSSASYSMNSSSAAEPDYSMSSGSWSSASDVHESERTKSFDDGWGDEWDDEDESPRHF